MRIISLKTVTSIGLVLGLLMMFGCGGSSSSDPAVKAPINLNGGNANPAAFGSLGGSGGYFYVESYGELTLTTNSSVTTLVPPEPATTLLYEVVADEEVQLDPTADVVGLYVVTGDIFHSIYLGDGDATSINPPINGLFVPQGITLTLPNNDTTGFLAWFDDDVVINGTIKTKTDSLDIYFDTFGSLYIGKTGLITTKPANPGMVAGNITLVTTSDIINNGIIDGSGSNGTFAATVVLDSSAALYNTGIIRAEGDNTAVGLAGLGGDINFYARNGVLFSSGKLSVIGGNSTNGDGGDGGYIYLENGGTSPLDMLISGTLQANGGSGDLSGGYGGGIDVFNYSNGNVMVTSYDGITLNGGTGDIGGIGGDVYAYTSSPDGFIPAGPISTNINIAANGGNGSDTGGNGGTIDVSTDFGIPSSSDPSTFITFSGSMNADGGDGTAVGGNGGDIILFSADPPTDYTGALSANAGFGSIIDGTITVDGTIIFP